MPKAAKINQLFERFVICGLSSESLCTVAGEAGFLGTNFRYRSSVIDQLPHTKGEDNGLPPQLPACCLPSGVDIILKADVTPDNRHPRTYTVVLTDGDGTKHYASCLSFYDDVPAELAAKHEELCGAQSLKVICLLSHKPYLTTCEETLRRLYQLTFYQACSTPIPDLIHSLLQLPCPVTTGSKVCFTVEGQLFTAEPPTPIGPPLRELSLRPLLEALRADQLATLFVAMLLERSVLLRSQQYWLLSAVAGGLCEVLYPFRFQHVYIPIMPYNLVDYLEAPTIFLMGLHSSVELDSRSLEGILVMDLDRQLVRNDESLAAPKAHPAVVQLMKRLALLQQPSIVEADVVAKQPDAWTAVARSIAGQPWGPSHERYMRRAFLEAMLAVVQGYDKHVTALVPSPSTSRGPAAGSSVGFNADAFVKQAAAKDRSSQPLLSQAVQCNLFVSFLELYGPSDDPYSWYTRAVPHMRPGTDPDDSYNSSSRDTITVPPLRQGLLQPPPACVHRYFPALIYSEEGDGGVARVRRKTGSKKQRRLSRVSATKRRAISDLMGAGDLRRKSPSVDDVAPRLRSVEWGTANLHLQLISNSGAASGGPLSTISGSSSGSSGATTDYLAEADLVRKQTSALMALLADGDDDGGGGGSGGGSGIEALEAEMAKDLLSVQTGGNGWFLVSRLKEVVCSAGAAADGQLRRASSGAAGQQQQQQQGSSSSLGAPICELRDRYVSKRAFRALASMFDSMVTAAHVQDDMRVIHTLLQLAHCFCRRPAHCLPQRLLPHLRTNPLWYQEQLWVGVFNSAVSTQYLGAAEHLDLQQVVLHQLTEFCRHITGLGITGDRAWQLIQRLGLLHLQHAPAAAMMAIRAHLVKAEAAALQQLALAFGPAAAAEAAGLRRLQQDACKTPPRQPGAGRPYDQSIQPSGALSPCSSEQMPSFRSIADSAGPAQLQPLKRAAMLAAGGMGRSSFISRSAAASDSAGQVLAMPVLHQEQPHRAAVTGIDANNGMAVSVSQDDSIRVYDVRDGYLRQYACLPLRPSRAARGAVRVWNQGQKAAVANADGFHVWVLDIATSSPAVELQGCRGAVQHLQVSGCGTLLVAAGAEPLVRLWDVRRPDTDTLTVPVAPDAAGKATGSSASALLYSSEKQLLAVASKSDCCVRVWDMRQAHQPLSTCRGHQDWVTGLALLPAASRSAGSVSPRLVSCSLDWSARCWQLGSAQAACDGALVGHGSGLTALQVLEVGCQQKLVTGAQDGCVALWSPPAAGGSQPEAVPAVACSQMLPSMGGAVRLLAQAADDWLLAGCSSGGCRLYDAAALVAGGGSGIGGGGPEAVAVHQGRARVGCMAWDSCDLQLYAGGVDGSVSRWDCGGGD